MKTISPSEPKYWNKKYRSKKGNDLYVVGDDGQRVRVMYVNYHKQESGHLIMSITKWEELIEKGEVSWVEDGQYVLYNKI